MKTPGHLLRTLSLATALVVVHSTVALACPSCKAGLGEADQAGLVQGFFWSILFMMSMPFAIIGTFGTVMYRAVNKARAEQAAKEAASRESELVEG